MKSQTNSIIQRSAQSKAPRNQTIDLETEYLKIRINNRGHQAGLIDKTSGKNYLQSVAPLWKLIINRKEYGCTQIEMHGRELTVHFGKKAFALFRLQGRKHYFTLELVTVRPEIAQISLIELNLKAMKTIAQTINAAYDDKFAFCVMALTLPVHCVPSGSNLQATCYAKYGLQGNKIAVIGCPTGQLRPLIQKIEKAEGLPHITLGGKWSRLSDNIKHSYLFLHDIGEANCDRAIAYARKMNVGMIMILETWASRTMGHFPINRSLFPHGQEGLKSVVAKIHKAGMKAGLHFLCTGVSCNDSYLTPIPDPRLFKDAAALLADDIDQQQQTIPCVDCPRDFQEKYHPRGVFFGKGIDFQIDDEVISYESYTKTPPYRFTQCRRGAYGTKAAAHHKGAKIAHLMRSYSYFIADRDSSLMNEIAERIGKILDDCRFDMLYFDGNEKLQGDLWYYHPKILLAFYHCISPSRRNHIFFQSSSGGAAHFSSHLISRTACADGYENVKDNVNNARRYYPNLFNNFTPLDIGWYGIGQKSVSYSDIEYILSASLGWDSSVGFSTSLGALDQNLETNAMLEMAGNYERLRLQKYFPESIKARLRRGGEYHLVKLSNNKWDIFDQKERTVRSINGIDNRWIISCAKKRNVAALQIRVGDVLRPDSGKQTQTGIPLVDFKNGVITRTEHSQTPMVVPFGEDSSAINKTKAEFHYAAKGGHAGNGCGHFKVKSRLADKSGWTVFAHQYRPPLNLKFMNGIGFWIRGDGKGACLKIRLQDPSTAWTDFAIRLDFTGWQYRELAIFEDVVVPDYRGPIDKSHVTHLFFFVTGIKSHAETSFQIEGLTALPKLSAGRPCRNPSVSIGNRTVTFPVSLKQGDFLTSSDGGQCVITDRQGKKRVFHPAGRMPVFRKGKNTITFNSAHDLSNEIKIRISDIPVRG